MLELIVRFLLEPAAKPSNVQVNVEIPNVIEISWSPLSDENQVTGPINGFQIRIVEINALTRRKRDVNKNVKIITVDKTLTSKRITDISKRAAYCTVEVAMFSAAGLGPYTSPLIVRMKKEETTTKKADVQTKPLTTATTATKKDKDKDYINGNDKNPGRVGRAKSGKTMQTYKNHHHANKLSVVIIVGICMVLQQMFTDCRVHLLQLSFYFCKPALRWCVVTSRCCL